MKNNKLTKFLLFIFTIGLAGAAYFGYYNHPWVGSDKYITILHTNDIHGRLRPFYYKDGLDLVGGLARRATLIKQIEGANKCAITVDAGDFAQGSLFFNYFSGMPDAQLMSEVGYDVGTLGNHEFDKGLKALEAIIKEIKYPVVASNIQFPDNPDLQSLVKPYLITNYCGFKVGFIGLVPEDLKEISKPKNIEVFDTIETTKNLAEKLNPHVDLIVVISHIGVDKDIKLAKSVPEVDVIVGGHTHTLIKQPKLFNKDGDKTLVLQTGELGVNLGRLDLKIKDKKIENYYYELIPINEEIEPDKGIKNKIAVLAEQIASLTEERVGQLAVSIGVKGENIRSKLLPAGSLVTDAIKNKFPEVDVVLQNSGGLRPYKTLGPGAVTKADIMKLFPFDNTAVVLELKGKDLKSVLETSSNALPSDDNGGFLQTLGLEYSVNIKKPSGDRVSDVLVNGQPLQEKKYYKIAINSYMYEGGNGYYQFKDAKNIKNTNILIQDLIIDYIRENSPVSVEVRDKINFIEE